MLVPSNRHEHETKLVRLSVYALGMENVGDDHLGLTGAQLRARRHLMSFIDLVSEIATP